MCLVKGPSFKVAVIHVLSTMNYEYVCVLLSNSNGHLRTGIDFPRDLLLQLDPLPNLKGRSISNATLQGKEMHFCRWILRGPVARVEPWGEQIQR